MARPRGQTLDEVTIHRKTQTGCLRYANCAFAAYFDFGLNDVFVPISLAGGNISRQSETRLSRHGNVVGATDPGLQHASAPDGDSVFAADVMNLASASVSSHAPELDVDDAAGVQLDCSFGMTRIRDALVQTDRGADLRLQFRVPADFIPLQRLLHHE